jgi:myo-inositol-1(or 4)-monophosphatase
LQSMSASEPGTDELREMESRAVEMVREAGTMALESFRRPLHVEFKEDQLSDPVTNVDRGVEEFLRLAITRHFPGHAVLGEEGTDQDVSEHEMLWVLDPLDGTTNFLNGLPLFACSAGLLRRGVPVVGAMFLPVAPRPPSLRPAAESDGDVGERSPLVGYSVLHARLGGGAYLDGSPAWASDAEKPHPAALTGFPAHHAGQFWRGGDLRRNPGELRSLGSICFESAMVAVGVLRYAVFRLPAIWDVAASSLIVREAGGECYQWRGGRWEPLTRFDAMPNPKAPGERHVRYWRAPVLVGGKRVAGFVAERLRPRVTLRARVAEAAARLLGRR